MEKDFFIFVSTLAERLKGIRDYRTADAYMSTSRSVAPFSGGPVGLPAPFRE